MPKVSRNSFTVAKKLSVILWHQQNGSNLHKTSSYFSIDRKQIRDWVSKEDQLKDKAYGKEKLKRSLGSGRKPLSEELDDDLFEIFEKERQAGRAVSNKFLSKKALGIAERIGLNEFKASPQFICNWKKRFNVSMRKGTNASQKAPEELAVPITAFLKNVKRRRIEKDYTMYNIGNMDQTMVRFDSPSSSTNNAIGESTVRITNTGCTKRGFTVALSARASGHKMPAYCIFKEPSGRIPPRVLERLQVPKNVHVTSSVNGWMTSEKFKDWVLRIWGPNVDDVDRLLVLDMAPIHKTEAARDILSSVDTESPYIPPGCTAILQPADVSWNQPFKAALKENWEAFMTKEEKTKKGNLKRPSRQDLLTWISRAWESVSEECIKKSFKSCGISNALDGSENGLYNSNLARAVQADGNELRQEAVDLLLESDEESDDSFLGFSDSEEE